MTDYDVFNGDADGICSLIQLRLAEPRDATLVTGVKRDISLLARVPADSARRVTALDISLDKNREALNALLDAGAEVFYADHHFAGDVPEHASLSAHINTAPEVCTAAIVNERLGGAYTGWAVVGAFGDNLRKTGLKLAAAAGLGDDEADKLERLGIYVNYNAYGATLEDLHFDPAELYATLARHTSPLDFIGADAATFDRLESSYQGDMQRAADAEVLFDAGHAQVLKLPDAAWARRVSGVYGNHLAQQHQARAHAIVTDRPAGGLQISVRAPLGNRQGADEICRQFPTGGGRTAAAGVNELPEEQLARFIDVFEGHYRGT